MKTYRIKFKLTFVFADILKKRIFYRSSIENSSSLEDAFISANILDKQINVVFSAVHSAGLYIEDLKGQTY